MLGGCGEGARQSPLRVRPQGGFVQGFGVEVIQPLAGEETGLLPSHGSAPPPKLLGAAETPCMRTFSFCSNPPLIGSIYIASHTAHTGEAPGRWIAPKTVNGPEGGIEILHTYIPALPSATLRLPGSQLHRLPHPAHGPLRESLTHSHIDREVSHRVPRAASVSRTSRPCNSQVSVVDSRRTTVYYVLR